MAYVPRAAREVAPARSLVLVDLSGHVTPLDLPAGQYYSPRFSRDGKRIALYTNDGVIWIYDIGGTKRIRKLTLEGGNRLPLWTRDGRVIFESMVQGQTGLWWQSADGSAPVERLMEYGERSHFPHSVSPDGKTLFLKTRSADRGDVITSLARNAATTPEPLPKGPTGGLLWSPTLSRDGRSLAYEWRREKNNNIYVDPFPPTGVHHPVTTEGGSNPMWSPDGKRLFYTNPSLENASSSFYAVEVLPSGTSFEVGKSTMLFSLDRHFFGGGPAVDLSPDGRQFVTLLLPQPDRESEQAQVDVILNWFTELKERVPVN